MYFIRMTGLLLFILSAEQLFPQSTFYRVLGTASTEFGNDLRELANGNFIICGAQSAGGDTNAYLMLTSPKGEILWTKTYGAAGQENFESICLTTDGGFAAIGQTSSYQTHSDRNSLFVVKTDSLGNLQWARVFSTKTLRNSSNGYSIMRGQFIRQIQNGDLFLGGFEVQPISNSANSFILGLTTDGTTKFFKRDDTEVAYTALGNQWSSHLSDMAELSDRSIIVMGNPYNSSGYGKYDLMLNRYNANGTLISSNHYGSAHNESVWHLELLGDEEFLLTGNTGYPTFNYGPDRPYFLRVDKNFQARWSASLDVDNRVNLICQGAVQTGTGEYVVSVVDHNADADGYLVKINESGVIWAKAFGGPGRDKVERMIRTRDGGFAVIGKSNSYGAGGDDVLFVKTDQNGNLDCRIRDINAVLTPHPFSGKPRPTVYTDMQLKLDVSPAVQNQVYTGRLIGIQLTASSTDEFCDRKDGSARVDLINAAEPVTYAWQTSTPSGSSSLTGLDAGQYRCIITDGVGCRDTVDLLVADKSLLIQPELIPSDCDNANGQIILHPGSDDWPLDISWQGVPGAPDTVVSGLSAFDTVSVTVSDQNGCLYEQTFQVPQKDTITLRSENITQPRCYGSSDGSVEVEAFSGQAPYSYQWTCNGTSRDTIAFSLSAGNYSVVATDAAGCKAVLSGELMEPDSLYAVFTGTPDICLEGNGTVSAVLTGGTMPYAYSWNTVPPSFSPGLSGLRTGFYQLQVNDAHGCTRSFVYLVDSIPPPVITGTVYKHVQCEDGNDGRAEVSASGSGELSYVWNTSPPVNSPVADGLRAGTYICRVSNEAGCFAETSVTLNELYPIPVFDIGQDTVACSSTPVSFGFSVQGASYRWSTGETTPFISAVNPGPYTLYMTVNGCEGNASARLNHLPAPDINLRDAYTCPLDSVVLDAFCYGCTYLWDNGASTRQITGVPVRTYSVNITDYQGCVYTRTATVNYSISDSCGLGLFVPNAFTPDVDGFNEVFRPLQYGLELLKLEIYTRFGELIFESTAAAPFWDGTYKLEPCKTDVYVWQLTYRKLTEAGLHKHRGIVSLLR